MLCSPDIIVWNYFLLHVIFMLSQFCASSSLLILHSTYSYGKNFDQRALFKISVFLRKIVIIQAKEKKDAFFSNKYYIEHENFYYYCEKFQTFFWNIDHVKNRKISALICYQRKNFNFFQETNKCWILQIIFIFERMKKVRKYSFFHQMS